VSQRSVIVAGVRTPIARVRGSLATFRAVELGAIAIRAALRRAGVQPEQVEYVLMGHVLQAGQGQITARQAAVAAGVPAEVPAVTVNKVCLSGMSAIAIADQMIRAGDLELAVAGGMESMTNAPYVLPAARAGSRMGDAALVDSMLLDGLTSPFSHLSMGLDTDGVNAELWIGREEQDAWAARSHGRAQAAWDEGRMAEEVVPVEIAQRRGDVAVFDRDEGVRPDTTPEALSRLGPAFSQDGTVTAGNASQISDGAAAVVIASERRAEELGLEPLVEVLASGMSADRFPSLHTVPAIAMQRALKKAGLDSQDLDLVEINEAFAAIPIHSARMLGISEEIVNVNGGAVALGHPIGASGARIVLSLAAEMVRRRVDLGGVAICGGGGQGDALVLRRANASAPDSLRS
jgi:acetyl-CoA C-acetyltransferase